MLAYLDKWTGGKGDPADIDAANRRLDGFRIASDSLQQLDADQADHASAIEASRFGSDGANHVFFDVILFDGNKREYLLDLVAAQGLAAAIQDHLSVSPFLG
jgi:hypothetical protein